MKQPFGFLLFLSSLTPLSLILSLYFCIPLSNNNITPLSRQASGVFSLIHIHIFYYYPFACPVQINQCLPTTTTLLPTTTNSNNLLLLLRRKLSTLYVLLRHSSMHPIINAPITIRLCCLVLQSLVPPIFSLFTRHSMHTHSEMARYLGHSIYCNGPEVAPIYPGTARYLQKMTLTMIKIKLIASMGTMMTA